MSRNVILCLAVGVAMAAEGGDYTSPIAHHVGHPFARGIWYNLGA